MPSKAYTNVYWNITDATAQKRLIKTSNGRIKSCFSGVSSLAEVCDLTDAYAGMKYNRGGIFASLYRVIREQQSLL
ncbi:hypothetical protein V1477_003402 [Vespula maculifrons]|uniref:Uncharacterized protein n=1 Tax=Vespula maculifrons TaxID=7453 RepID=A0ABD2CVH4_VESMC